MEPVEALNRIAFLLERAQAPTYRVRAFRTAAAVIGELSAAELAERVRTGTLDALKGIGPKTGKVVREALDGQVPGYLADLEDEAARQPLASGGERLRYADILGHCTGRLLTGSGRPESAFHADAHAPGQLDWQAIGCARAEECGVPAERVVTTWTAEDLLAWTAGAGAEPGPGSAL